MPDTKPKVSKAQQRAVAKYMKTNYDEIKIRVPKGSRDRYKAEAAAAGESLNSFCTCAIEEKIERLHSENQ